MHQIRPQTIVAELLNRSIEVLKVTIIHHIYVIKLILMLKPAGHWMIAA